MKFYIYRITNLINTKIYIGKTCGEHPQDRFYHHLKNAFYVCTENDCPKLYRSIRKYGIDYFEFNVIQTYESEDVAYLEEEKYISLYNSYHDGLNSCVGGKGTGSGSNNPMFGKGYKIVGEKNGMHGKVGELNPFYGKTHTEEVLNKIKQVNRVLNKDEVNLIRLMISEKVNYKIIGEKFKITGATISRIKNGQRYADV